MYYDFFNLTEHPFRLTTDPRFLFLSKSHSQARAYMEYALRNDDKLFILSGEIGAGKSLIIQSLLDELDDNIIAFRIYQTLLNNIEFLQMLLREFGIKAFHERKVELLDQIYAWLVEQHRNGKRVLVIIDEAQNLAPEVMEEIRLLLEFEADGEHLLNLFLIGQPELNHVIDQPELEQLRQRARLRYHLEALNEDDIRDYIQHRLSVASENHSVILNDSIFPLIYEYTGGRPRLINVLMDHALTYAFVENTHDITTDVIMNSINELNWQPYWIPAADIPVLDKDDEAAESEAAESIMQETLTEEAGENNSEGQEIVPSRKIIVHKKGRKIGEYPLNKSRFNIGRHSDNDIVLKEPRISRLHAQIVMNDREVFIQDMNSKNGTYSSNKRIDLLPLQPGDVITIASFELTFARMEDEEHEDNTESVNILRYPFHSRHKH